MFKVLRERKDRKMIKKSFKDLKKREKETSRRMAQLDTSLKLFRKAHKLEKQGKLDKAIALYKKNLQL